MVRIVVALAFALGAVAAHGETVAEKAVACGACHGVDGVPEDKTTPIIWGQNAGYLYLQFRDFQKGARSDDRMTAVARNLVKDDALALAEYFAARPWPKTRTPPASKAETDAATAALKSMGCPSCHRATFVGDASVPRTAGQERDYLIKTMTEFKSRARSNNPDMSDVLHAFGPGELSAIAAYLAGL